jgi:hypothetical protein
MFKELDAQALCEYGQNTLMPIADEVHTVPGGLRSTTVTSCARAGCEKPSRGTGGTSKYCSLACMEQDESDEEEEAEASTVCAPAERPGIVTTTYRISDCTIADMEASEQVGVAQQAKIDAMSIERLEANFKSALPLRSLIFLDVDGVLNATAELDSDEVITSDTPMMILNRTCLQRLVRLVRDNCARVVLSSTWRTSTQLKSDLWKSLVAEGLPKDAFIGQTPVIDFSLRHYEIKEWLNKHMDARSNLATEVAVPWVVLDDMKLGHCPELKDHFVWVNPNVGLSDKDLEMAAQMLSTSVLCST